MPLIVCYRGTLGCPPQAQVVALCVYVGGNETYNNISEMSPATPWPDFAYSLSQLHKYLMTDLSGDYFPQMSQDSVVPEPHTGVSHPVHWLQYCR